MASGIITMTSSASDFEGRIKYSSTLNESSNTSTLTLTYQVHRIGHEGSIGGNSSGYSVLNTITSSNNVTNTKITYLTSGNLHVDNNGSWTTIHTTTHTVTHAGNGTASLTMTCQLYGTVNKVYFNVENKTITLDTIVKKATLTSAPNFTNNDNPTVTYNNPMGNNVSGLHICISLDGPIADISYRSVSKTGTSYTFNLTDAERNILINATSGANRSIKFILRMTVNGTYYYSVLTRTFTLSNVAPSLSPTVIDTDSTTIALTGDSSKLIQYFSDAKIAFNAAGQNGATISSTKCVCGNKSRTSDGTISNVESGTFVFTVTDSRGFTNKQTVTKTLVPYIKLTTKLQLLTMNTNGTGAVSISGNLFRGSFGKVTNNPVVSYRFREQGGSWGSWQNVNYNITNDSYYSEVQLNGLNYQKSYDFEAKAVDSLMTVTTSLTVRCMPVFDWGESSFQFNVPVRIDGNLVVSGNITSNTPVAEIDIDAAADYVVETGTSDIWTYRKWNSGVAECWGTIAPASYDITGTWGSIYTKDNAIARIYYPFEFVGVPVVSMALYNTTGNCWYYTGTQGSALMTPAFGLARGTSGTVTTGAQLTAMGRWK